MTEESPQTLTEALARAAEFPQTGLRLLDRRERARWLPWFEVEQQAREVAGGLRALGVAAGDRVALVFPTGAEFFAAFFGVLRGGAVPVPLYPPVRLGRLQEYHQRTAAILNAVGARLVLTDKQVRRLLGPTMLRADTELGCATLAELPFDKSPAYESAPDDLALIQFSSGTTTEPKPVALTHRAVLAQTRLLNQFWPDSVEIQHSGVSWLPLYHDMGLIGCVFPALERPAILTLLPPEVFVARPALWLRAISRYRATVSPAPNFAYGLCVEKVRDADLNGVDLSCWRVALNGAESIAPRVLQDFQARFRRWGLRPEALTPVYGLSEAALAVTFSALDRPFRRVSFSRRELAAEGRAKESDEGTDLVSVGRPLPGFELQIRGPAGEVLAERSVGRLWVRGPSLMQGYFGRPDLTTRVLQQGWLDTGDLGFLLDGELFLTGRAKDLIIHRGRNYPPADLEQALVGVPGFRAGCCAAVAFLPEEGDRECLVLLVERHRQATAAALGELERRCRERVLARVGLELDEVVVLTPGTLPRTSSGKIRRSEALKRYREQTMTPPEPVNALRLAKAMVRSGTALRRSRRA